MSKIPVMSSGIEPATFQLVAQCLNQLRHHVPLLKKYLLQNSGVRFTKNAISLIDVFITKKNNHEKLATIVDWGYSDLKAQILYFSIN
jgi:hypothetical protein